MELWNNSYIFELRKALATRMYQKLKILKFQKYGVFYHCEMLKSWYAVLHHHWAELWALLTRTLVQIKARCTWKVVEMGPVQCLLSSQKKCLWESEYLSVWHNTTKTKTKGSRSGAWNLVQSSSKFCKISETQSSD